MSLCNTNWKNVLSGGTHPPDVDFIVNGQDGERVFPAHRYLLAIVSPVLKEQFYGETRGNLKDASGRIKICLDSSYSAVDAFFKYIFENCFGNLSFNDLFELLRLSERFQIVKMSNDVKEVIVKFIVDNKVETVEEISVLKKVEKDLKDKLITMKDKLGQMAEEHKSLEHIGQQCKKELKKKNEKLEHHLNIIRSSFELVEAKLKLDIDTLKKDRNVLTEENKKLKHNIESMLIEEKNKNSDMVNLQKEQEILIEEKEVLVEENKTLKSQITDFALEKERISDLCNSLSLSNGRLMKGNAEMKEKMQQIAENAKMKGVAKSKKNILRILKEISMMNIVVTKSTHNNTDDGNEKTNTENFKVGDSFLAQWIQDGLWSRGVIHSVYSNGKIVVRFINSGKWKELPTDEDVFKTSNNQTQKVVGELIKMQPGCSTIKSEQVEAKHETYFEAKENNCQWSYSNGSSTLISFPTREEYQEIERRASTLELKNKSLELENKLLKERVSTTRETFKKALINSNVRHKTMTDEKKLLEEEMEAMKIAYGTQIDFLKKENGSLNLRHSIKESDNDPAEMSSNEFENKAILSNNNAETSPKQALIEVSPKVNLNEQNVINEELTDVKETVARTKQELEQLKTDFEDKNEQLDMIKDELNKINEELADVKETLTYKKQELEKLKIDFDDKNEELTMIKNNVAMLKKVENNLTLAEKNLHATIKSLNEDKKKLENEQLKSSTSICVSPLAKKPRLSFDSSDEGAESEDLRMSLDQRKIKRVLAKNVESGNLDVNKATAVHDDGEYVDSASGRSVNNSPLRAPKPLEKNESAGSQNLSPARHRTPERGEPFRTRRLTPSSSAKNGRSRTQSPQNREKRITSSRNRKSIPRRLSSSPKKRPHSPKRSSPSKRPHKVKQERKDFDKIRVTVQREGIRSPSDNESCSVSIDQAKTIQQICITNQMAENVDEGMSRRFSEEVKMSVEKGRMRIITMDEENLKHRLGERNNKKEKKSHDARDRRIPQAEDCGKGKVFQRLGGKTIFLKEKK